MQPAMQVAEWLIKRRYHRMNPTNTKLVIQMSPAFKTHRRNLIEESHQRIASQREATYQYCDETLTEQEKEFCGII